MLARAPQSIVLLVAMLSHTCANCGAELVAGARFCRRCGQPSSMFERGSVTEAETRVFEQTAERGQQTQYYDQRPTGPSYMAPHEMSSPQTATTTGLESSGRRRRGILIGSALVIVMLIGLTFAAVYWSGKFSSPATIAVPEAPPPPITVQPPQVPQVPQPPQPPSTGKGSASALDYPGADVVMEMTRGTKGSIRQLSTTDSLDKVVAWYVERIKPTENIKIPGSQKAVLRADGITVDITAEDGETKITLLEGIDR